MNKKYQSILDAAIKLYLKQGVGNTTLEEVAEVAVCSKVTLYKYFNDKDNLLRKVSAAIYDEYINELNEIKDSDNDIRWKIENTLVAMTDFMADGRFELCHELSEASTFIKSDNAKMQAKYKEILSDLIDKGKENNIIRNDINSLYIFYYIDMSASYYQNNLDYRNLIDNDDSFQKEFLGFLIGNIFINADNAKKTGV